MITEFNNPNLKALRADINSALASVMVKHGIRIRIEFNNISYRATKASTRLKMSVAGASALPGIVPPPVNRSKEDFELNAAFVGLLEEDFGRSFRHNGKNLKIVGTNVRSKYPIVVEDEQGKGYRVSLLDVLQGLIAAGF